MLKQTNYLTKVYGLPQGWKLAAYERELRGYEAAKKVLTTMQPADVVAEAKKANIRGRGGAGFPMGVKWSFMRPHPTKQAYLVLNADEGEPGTHKDRTIMELNPHSVVEGCIIGCYGIGAHVAYIYVRDELHLSKARLEGAIKEARAKGYLGKTPFGNPTTVNNLETIAIVPTAFAMGCEAFSKMSAIHHMNDGGVRLFGVNGHVKKPQIVELAVGVTLREMIYDIGGGVLGDRDILG